MRKILSSDSWRSRLGILIIATVVLLIRKTDALSNPQFWAEDGTVFFLQEYEEDRSVIFQPYAGYLLVIPRLIALFSDFFFPYREIPLVYNFSSLILTLFVVFNIFSPRFKIDHKPLLALAIVLVPHPTNEVFLNITNIQWITALLIIIVLMKENPHREYGNINFQIALDFTVVILCGLTGPFIIFLMPFFTWKWFENKNSYNASIALTAIAISCIQLFFILGMPRQSVDTHPLMHLNAYSAVIGYKVFGSLFFGINTVYKLNAYLLSFLYIGLMSALLTLSSRKSNFILYCLGIQAIFVLATLYRFKNVPEALIPVGNGERYFYIPRLMLTWALIDVLVKYGRWKNIVATMALVLILISSLTSGFRSPAFVDYNWESYSQSIGKEDIVIPINPAGWQINIEANP